MDKGAKQPLLGSINVPLAIFWSESGKLEYEIVSLRAATQPMKWSESLDVTKRLWLVNKVNTSAIFGEPVVVLDQEGDWLFVAAVNQRTRGNQWGQVGWVPAEQICFNSTYLREQLNQPDGVIFVPRAILFRDDCLTHPMRTLSYQVRLPILAEGDDVFKVSLPDGDTGYLDRSVMQKVADLCFSRKNIIAQARQFTGLRYIWGGTSSYGFDCSGFMFRLYQSQGISIPRNSISQAQEGTAVGKDCLLPGDLLFFANEGGKGSIHHVGMYIGNGTMIHSPESKSAVKESRIDTEPYRQEYWGAKRYVD